MAVDPLHILVDAAPQLLISVLLNLHLPFQLFLEPLVQTGIENLPEDTAPLLRARQQQFLEIPLGDHGYLCELPAVQANQLRHGLGHVLCLGDRLAPVRIGQHRVRLLERIAAAPPFRPIIFWISFYCICFVSIQESEFHVGGDFVFGVFAAEHVRSAHVSAGLSVQRKGDGVKNGGLSRTGIPGDQVQPLSPKSVESNLCPVRIRSERADDQFHWFHNSFNPSMVFSMYSLCSGLMGWLFCSS